MGSQPLPRFEALQYRKDAGVAEVVIDRPEVRNAISLRTMAELEAVVSDLEHDPEVLAVILTGAGDKAFVSGGDLKEFRSLRTVHDGREMSLRMGNILQRLHHLEVPVIAAINGDAYGGGCETALACDLRLAAPHARLGFRQIIFGVTPGWGGGQRLLRLVGRSKALELLLTGATLTAEEALAIGLVDRVVNTGDVRDAARELAARIAGHAPLAIRSIKRALTEGANMPLDAAIAYESELFSVTWGSEDHWEAEKAFWEKRPPRFKGV
jgi:enoyl-CoA hydratase